MLFDTGYNDELNVAEEEEQEFTDVDITLDSGAAVHVMDRYDAPKHEVVPSVGSKKGQYYVAANGEHIYNEGKISTEMHVPRDATGRGRLGCEWQIAKVSRPLMSMSKMCDRGLEVHTTKTHAKVMDDKGNVVAKFDRVGGLYVASVKMKNPRFKSQPAREACDEQSKPRASPFGGPSKRR